MKSLPICLLLCVLSSAVAPAHLAGASPSSAASMQRKTSKLKGTIKSVGAESAVIVPADNKQTEITFRLTSSTEKTGSLSSGDAVEVEYYFEQGQRVATALAGKASAR
ncbi:MAG: hypothetical protein IT184_12720 [Acidobacteria bacterium]|nr:hypothetical protein [Acidobacteriota bacterium]